MAILKLGGAQDNFHLLGGATTHIPHFDLNSVIPKEVDLLVLFLGHVYELFLLFVCKIDLFIDYYFRSSSCKYVWYLMYWGGSTTIGTNNAFVLNKVLGSPPI